MMLLLALLALAQEPALTPEDEARAREIYENGATLYEEGLYEEAILAFEEAYAVSRRPALLYNIANAYERLGKWNEALDALNRYRVYAREEEREAIERRIRNLERRMAEQAAAAPPVSTTGSAPPPAPVDVTPPPEPVKARGGAGWVLLGAGGLLAVGGGTLAGTTWAESRGWIEAGDQERWERWRPANNAGVVVGGVGGALLLSGVVVVAIDGPALSVGPGGLSARFTW